LGQRGGVFQDLRTGTGGSGAPEALDFAALEAGLGHRFREPALLVRALTHPSFAHENPPAPHNEVPAFLGDAVLGLVVAELVAAQAPMDGAGPLTQRRASLVSARTLARWASHVDLPAHLRLGRGEALTGGAAKESILATAFEAVVGAVYLDAGLAGAQALVARLVDQIGAAPTPEG
jgi:ribonuclease-3